MRSHVVATVCRAAAGSICFLVVFATADAHHSVAGQFDMSSQRELKGVISNIDWINPHTYVYLSVQEPNGTLTTWRLEALPVAMMRKAGISKAALICNAEKVTVRIHPARDGTQHLGYLQRLEYPGGRFYQFAPEVAPTPAVAK